MTLPTLTPSETFFGGVALIGFFAFAVTLMWAQLTAGGKS